MSEHAHQEFRALIERAQRGDEQAFSALYTLWYTPIFRFVLARVGERSDAEDLTQDIFLKLCQVVPTLQLRAESPLSYLYTIARNRVTDHYRKKKSLSLEALEIEEVEDKTMDPLKDSIRQNDLSNIAEALTGLSQEYQDIITLRVLEGLSSREVGLILGKSEEAVRQMQVRALRALRECVKE